jgi:hypothetical protein
VGIDEEQFRKNLASNDVVQLIKWEQKVETAFFIFCFSSERVALRESYCC